MRNNPSHCNDYMVSFFKTCPLLDRSIIKRSLSDGNILCESNTPASACNGGQRKLPNSSLSDRVRQSNAKGLSESTPEISTSESDISLARLVSLLCSVLDHIHFRACNYSNIRATNSPTLVGFVKYGFEYVILAFSSY